MKLTIKRVTTAESSKAAKVIHSHATRTPLVKLNWTRPAVPGLEIYLKLENLQPIGSFKVRGAMNAIGNMDRDSLMSGGIVTASAGNMGQAVAYAAQVLGLDCTVVVPDSAPQTKLDAMERRKAKVIKVPYDRWWEIICSGDASPDTGSPAGKNNFIHPVCDQRVVAGNSTIGLEILEDLPEVDAVFVPWGGGGLCCGVGSILQDVNHCDIYSCEPETAAPMSRSLEAKKMVNLGNDYQPSFVDGCGGKSLLPPMWPLAQELLTGAVAVPLLDIEEAIVVLLERNRVVGEGAGACPVAAAMFGREVVERGYKKVVCVVSGGCLNNAKLIEILEARAMGDSHDMAANGIDKLKAKM